MTKYCNGVSVVDVSAESKEEAVVALSERITSLILDAGCYKCEEGHAPAMILTDAIMKEIQLDENLELINKEKENGKR